MKVAHCTHGVSPSAMPALLADEIQVWQIPLVGGSDTEFQLRKLLSTEELDRAGRFHFVSDQRRFTFRRAVLRQLLAQHLGSSPQAIQLKFGTHGKPAVHGQVGACGLQFSCSHSADWALIALARGSELGVDLEQHRHMAEVEDLAKNFFSPSEISELMKLPPELKTAGFFNCWARKEAFVKAIGLGLSYPLNRFSVSLAPDKPAALLAVADDAEALKKWELISLDVIPNHYSAALVFERKQTALKYFTWNR